MKKVFLLKGLDCPHCSAEIEREVAALPQVSYAAVNLMRQTLTVEIDASFAEAADEEICALVHSHEPDVQVAEYKRPADDEHDGGGKYALVRLCAGAVMFLAGIIFGAPLSVFIAAYIILGADVVLKALKNLFRCRAFDENLLMSISSIGAFFISEHHEAVAVMLFYQIGEFFQELSVRRSRKSIADLMDIHSDTATVLCGEAAVSVPSESVEVGDIIIIKPGERIPLDGIVCKGRAMVDTKPLTGEAVPKTVHEGDDVLSGSIDLDGVLSVRVTKRLEESTASKIIALVEDAAERKASTENFITVFARYYTPCVVIAAVLLAVIPPITFSARWSDWIYRAMSFLVISCPCALVISVPLAFFGGIGAASKHGVLVKGGNFLETLDDVGTVVFDKTGTLTKGTFEVHDVIAEKGYTEQQVMEYAAFVECLSVHPIAKSILAAYEKPVDKNAVSEYREIPGHGVVAYAGGKRLCAGNEKMMQAEKISYASNNAAGTRVE